MQGDTGADSPGLVLGRNNQASEAEQACRRVADSGPGVAPLRHNLGKLEYSLGPAGREGRTCLASKANFEVSPGIRAKSDASGPMCCLLNSRRWLRGAQYRRKWRGPYSPHRLPGAGRATGRIGRWAK